VTKAQTKMRPDSSSAALQPETARGRSTADPVPRRTLGTTGLEVTALCAGAAELGDMLNAVGYAVPEDRARQTVHAVLAGPLNFMDTAAAYGDGKSEARIGLAIEEFGGLPDGFVLATKADMDQRTRDFSGDQARRSVERSLHLLRVDKLPLVYLHDVEAAHQGFREMTAPAGAIDALVQLQSEGVIEHIGFAGTGLKLTDRFLATGAFTVVITHNRLTLLDQSALPRVERWSRSMAVINAAPYAGGILARGAAHGRYMYRPQIPPKILQRLGQIERICASFGVPVAAAALQFSMQHEAVTSTIVGMSSPERIDETVRMASLPIPAELWSALGVAQSPHSGDASR
jgi:D-threo-aldose 1-dehydrogenase